jgi:hypothetical protein
MHGAALADEAGAEELEQAIHLQKDLPETARIFGIISCMGSILAKTNWVRHFVGPLANLHFYPEVNQSCKNPLPTALAKVFAALFCRLSRYEANGR